MTNETQETQELERPIRAYVQVHLRIDQAEHECLRQLAGPRGINNILTQLIVAYNSSARVRLAVQEEIEGLLIARQQLAKQAGLIIDNRL